MCTSEKGKEDENIFHPANHMTQQQHGAFPVLESKTISRNEEISLFSFLELFYFKYSMSAKNLKCLFIGEFLRFPPALAATGLEFLVEEEEEGE